MESVLKPGKQKESSFMSVYLWTLTFMKPYQMTLWLLILSGCVTAVTELIIPKYIQYFIDEILPQKDVSLLFILICVIGIVLSVQFALTAAQNLLRRILREKAARDLQYDIFTHLRSLGFSYFESNPIGGSLSLLNTEVAAVQRLYDLFPQMLLHLIFASISIVFMLNINVQLTMIIIPSLLLYYLVGPYFEKRASLAGKEWSESRKQLNQKVYETVSSLTELRAYSSEKWDLERLLQKQRHFNTYLIKTFWYGFLRGTIRRLSYHAGGVILFIYAFYMLKADTLTIGEFVAFLFFFFMTIFRLTFMITMITEQKVLMFQAITLYDFRHIEPEVTESPNPVRLPQVIGNIRMDDVYFKYPNGPQVLSGMSLSIKPGQKAAFVGTSGNGKSTILKLLSRFYDPQAGDIYLDGVSLKDLSNAQLRETIGYVFQETYLFGHSIMENIRFGNPEATDEEVMQAAKSAYAHDFIMELPERYGTLVGERGVILSGGQKQRISIARMFVKNPVIVLLDEATSALDNISEAEVQSALDRLLQGKTAVTIAHRLSTIKNSHVIFVIDQGVIAEQGSYTELMEMKGIFYKLSHGDSEKELIVHE